MKVNDLYQAAHLELIQQLNQKHKWGYSQASLCKLLLKAQRYLNQTNGEHVEISKVLFYFVTEHPYVESMQHMHDSHYHQQWQDFQASIEIKIAQTIRAKYPQLQNKTDDIVQEVIINIFESLDSFRYESRFKTWVYSIMFNILIDNVRRINRKNRLVTNVDDIADIVSDEDVEERVEHKQKLELALNLLYDHDKKVFDIVYARCINGVPNKDLAERYKCSDSTITRTIQKALKFLKIHPDISNLARSVGDE